MPASEAAALRFNQVLPTDSAPGLMIHGRALRALALAVSLFLLALGALALAAPVRAQGVTPTDDDVNAIARQLYCPVCENVPLDVCPTEACRQWRELIRSQLSEGMSESEIKEYFVINYGARVLSEPPRKGLYWLAYILPPVMVVAGVFVLVRLVRSWTRPSAQASPAMTSPAPPPDDYVARLEEELKRQD